MHGLRHPGRMTICLALALTLLAACTPIAPPVTAPPAAAPAPAAPPPQAPSVPATPKQATIAMWSSPGIFSPLSPPSSYSGFVHSLVFGTLLRIDPQNRFVPYLAEKWEVAADGKTYRFFMRKNARWHDGRPLTARDVVFTLGLVANPASKSSMSWALSRIEGTDPAGRAPGGVISGVRLLDEYTIELQAKTTNQVAVLETLCTNVHILPEHVLSGTAPEEIQGHPLFRQPTVGSGPFRFVRYETDQYVELEKNRSFFMGEPKLDKVFVRVVTPATMAAALEKGEIDFTAGAGIGEVPIDDWQRIRALPHLEAVTHPTTIYQYMSMNLGDPRLQDARVRRALGHAIDRQQLVARLLQGQGEAVYSPYTSASPYHNPTVEGLRFDPEKARKLLAEANFTGSEPFRLDVPLGNQVRERSGPLIQAHLQGVGVKVNLQSSDFQTVVQRWSRGEFQLALLGAGTGQDPDISSRFKTGAAANPGKYSHAKVDELLERGLHAPTFEAKKPIYDELQRILAEDDPPHIFLYSSLALLARNKRLAGVQFTPAFGVTWNAWEWDVR